MTEPAIDIRNLGKVYRVWRRPGDMLKEAVTGRRLHGDFQALADVSLDVPRGSITGVMGRNGAGKSTLLRIVGGTLDATCGTVSVGGRVAAILELGSGFHPDYTGRDNVLIGGMCIGLTRAEIRARFDEIVDFAELHGFMDQPFRTYSSGMQARLTFAVATSVDADIILIDEALSVGDARFQLKSFDRIRDFKRRGKTILLVSHDINAICSICDRAVLLERGRVHAEGDPARVGNIYHELLFGPRALTAASEAPVAAGREAAPVDAEHRYGLRTARIDRVEITKSALPAGTLRSLETYAMEFTIRASEATGPLHFGFLIRTPRAMTVCGWDTGSAGLPPLPPFAPGEVRVARVSFRANMAPGRYFLTAALARPDRTKEDVRFDALELTVEGAGGLHADSIVDLEVERPVVSLVSRSAERRKEA